MRYFARKTVWEADVEVFDLIGHPKAKRCYGWTYGEPEEFITILELPPVTDAKSAVKVVCHTRLRKQGANERGISNSPTTALQISLPLLLTASIFRAASNHV